MFFQVDSVLKEFQARPLLTDIFLSGEKGEVIGLLGRNGSGKSTLLKIIFGSIKADQKFVRVHDKVVNSLEDSRNLICYLPQHSFLPKHLKVEKSLSILSDSAKGELLKRKPSFQGLLKKKPNQISSGERRLLEIYLSIFSTAPIVLLDEPFNGVAPLVKEEVIRVVNDHSLDKVFIVTDHDYQNVLKISTRNVVLSNGRIFKIGGESDLQKHGYLPKS